MGKFPNLTNFSEVIARPGIEIGDDESVSRHEFFSGGRLPRPQPDAFLLASVRGLTRAKQPVDVEINGRVVGKLHPHTDGEETARNLQILRFDPAVLERDADTANVLRLRAAVDAKIKRLDGTQPLEPYRVDHLVCGYRRRGATSMAFWTLHDEEMALGSGAASRWTSDRGELGEHARFGYLQLDVKGLEPATRAPEVLVDDVPIGTLAPTDAGSGPTWETQIIPFSPEAVGPGEHHFEISAIGVPRFSVRSIMLFEQRRLLLPRRKEQPKLLCFIPIAVARIGESSFVVGEYTWVTEGRRRIGDSGETVMRSEFTSRQRLPGAQAALLLSVSGLTKARREPVVRLNGRVLGRLDVFEGADAGHRFTQCLTFSSDRLEDGENALEIEAVGLPGGSGTDRFDDFRLLQGICFFQRQRDAIDP